MAITAAIVMGAAGLTGCSDGDDGGTIPPSATRTPQQTATSAPRTATPPPPASPTQPESTRTASPTPAETTRSASPTATPTPADETTTPTPGPVGNGKVIFAANDETFSSDIFSINRDGTGRTNLTGSSDASESQPSFSPDGTRILYRKGDNTIAVMNADGTDPQTILTTVGPLYYPAWSPDGATIVFVADEALATQHDNTIDVVGADGSGRTTIVSAKGDYLSPSFSPDGSKIAYAANTGEMSIELFVVDSDGSNPQQITDDGTVHDSPVWSPVAASIAYVAAVPGTFASSIYLIKPDGTDAAPIPGANGGNPAWNRDGTEIAFGAFGVGISVANVDGTGKQLIANTSDGFDPDLE